MAKLHQAQLVGGGVEIKSALVAGAAADADIAVDGLAWSKDPRFIQCIHNTAGALADLLSEVVRGVTDAEGSIQLSDTATTGDDLLLVWMQRA
jgi:hypothetical protein